MAKRICPFCKEKVIENATICKHCKSELPALPPRPPKEWYQTWTGFLMILLVLGVIVQAYEQPSTLTSSQNSSVQSVPTPTLKPTPNSEKNYDEEIQKFFEGNVVVKIGKNTNSSSSTVWIGRGFRTLSYDEKNVVLGIVYLSIYPSDKRNILWLRDGMTNGDIGKFVPLDGGLVLK